MLCPVRLWLCPVAVGLPGSGRTFNALSAMSTWWAFSYTVRRPRRMCTACAGLGSSSVTGWKRRLSAGSFSKYFLYSRQVVAAMVRSSPRASAGLSRLAASEPPSLLPAPIRVWASSINRIMGVAEAFTASMTPFRRFSNSPFTEAPACSAPISSAQSSTFCRRSGTSALTMRRARPSTRALLPTPASPTTMGLFLRRRQRISIIWSISASRHTTGSSFPERASAVKSVA